MRVELVRMVADWLISDVNARIITVPVDQGDVPPPVIAPYADSSSGATSIAVFDESRHSFIAERKEPPAAPCLYVTTSGPISMIGEPYPYGQIRASQTPVKVLVTYLSENSERAVAMRDGDYTLRAVARSVRQLSRNENDAARIRNGLKIVLGEGPMEFWPVTWTVGRMRVGGGLVMNYLVRDMNPEF